MLQGRLSKIEEALKQAPGNYDAEHWAALFAGNEGRPVNEGDRQEARKMLQWCKEHGYPATKESCLEWLSLRLGGDGRG